MKNRKIINFIIVSGIVFYLILVLFYLHRTISFPQNYAHYELQSVETIENRLTTALEDDQQNLALLEDLNKDFPIDLLIKKEGQHLYSTSPVFTNDNFFDIPNSKSILYESSGNFVNSIGDHFDIYIRVYHLPTTLITNFIMSQLLILVVCFVLLIICLIMIVRYAIAPLIAIKQSLELMNNYNFGDVPLSNSSRDAINDSLRNVSTKISDNLEIISKDYTRYEEAFAQKSLHLNNTVLVTKSFIHDLKTPLIHQIYENELLLNSENTIEDVVSRNIELNKKTLEYVNQILNLIEGDSLINSDSSNVEAIDTTKMINSILKDFRMEIQRKGLEVNLQINQTIRLLRNPILVQLLFQNIISNMVTYALDDSMLTLVIFESDDSLIFKFINESTKDNQLRMGEKRNIFTNIRKTPDNEFSSGHGLVLIKELSEMTDSEFSLTFEDQNVIVQLIFTM